MALGQRQLKLTERQTAEMIKVAAQRPADRCRASSDYVSKTSGLLRDSTLRSFQLAVNKTMMKVSLSLAFLRGPDHAQPSKQPQCSSECKLALEACLECHSHSR